MFYLLTLLTLAADQIRQVRRLSTVAATAMTRGRLPSDDGGLRSAETTLIERRSTTIGQWTSYILRRSSPVAIHHVRTRAFKSVWITARHTVRHQPLPACTAVPVPPLCWHSPPTVRMRAP